MAVASVWKGEYYSRNSEVQKGWREELLSELVFKGNEVVLDIGCGDGRLTADLCPLVKEGRVLGIDASESMITWAQAIHGHIPNVRFEVKNALTLSYKCAFDWIFSTNCLHWVPNHRSVLKKIAQALKPKGKFYLLFCAVDDPLHPLYLAQIAAISSPRWKEYFIDYKKPVYSFRRRDYVTFALQAKIPHFTIIDVFSKEVFDNLTAFVDWMMGWLQGLERLPEALHRLFADEVGFRYIQYPKIIDERGAVYFSQKLWLIKGSV